MIAIGKQKMQINKNRTWAETVNGIYKYIEKTE